MKRVFGLFLVGVLLLTMIGCSTNQHSIGDQCLSFVVYAGGNGAGNKIYQLSLNSDRSGFDAGMELPIYRFDTLEDVEWFRTTFSTLPLDEDERGRASFQTVMSECDEAFFEKNSLMLAYLSAGSGSYRYGVRDVICDGDNFYIDVEQTNAPEIATCDMAYWFIIVTVSDEIVDGCTTFGARYVG